MEIKGKLLVYDKCGGNRFLRLKEEAHHTAGVYDFGTIAYDKYEEPEEGWKKYDGKLLCPKCSEKIRKIEEEVSEKIASLRAKLSEVIKQEVEEEPGNDVLIKTERVI